MSTDDAFPAFIPPKWLRNPHAMTLFPCYWPRARLLHDVPTEPRWFAVTPDTKILGLCHWQRTSSHHPSLLLLHGLEGCSDSHYMRGIASKAWGAGFNVVRLNLRNCGGTEHATPTFYHGGLSRDLYAVAEELWRADGLERIWLAGYSMGGNLMLRLAGEVGTGLPPLQGVIAVCPNIDPAACVSALEQRRNWLYHRFFVASLQARLRRKASLFPDRFDASELTALKKTLRAFDDAYTAPLGGFDSAQDYYERTGARHVLDTIAVPTLIVTSQDDPLIPYSTFSLPALAENPSIRFIAPRYGGHCGFFQRPRRGEDCFWAENRLIDFLISVGASAGTPPRGVVSG